MCPFIATDSECILYTQNCIMHTYELYCDVYYSIVIIIIIIIMVPTSLCTISSAYKGTISRCGNSLFLHAPLNFSEVVESRIRRKYVRSSPRYSCYNFRTPPMFQW